MDANTPCLIVGIGNRHVAEDALGCLVHDWLLTHPLPPGVAVVEGGLRGLDLLPLLEGRRRVVFADALAGHAEVGQDVVRVLTGEEVAAQATGEFGHGAGIPYLLAMLKAIACPPLPVCHVVGSAGIPVPTLVAAVAHRCLEVATHDDP